MARSNVRKRNNHTGPRRFVHSALREPPPPRIPIIDIFTPDKNDYRESPAFDRYCRRIAVVLGASSSPLSIREIHTRIGPSQIIRHWTFDALERVSVCHPGLIDRFSLNPGWTAPGRKLSPAPEEMENADGTE